MANRVVRFAGAALLVPLMSCGDHGTGPSPIPQPGPTVAVLVGAADISQCGTPGAEETAKLLDGIPGTVFTAGDNAYQNGTAEEFQRCYDPTWGRHRNRTYPVPGNHDYETAGGAPYYAYFGSRAGRAGQGYYSYNVGAWHVVALNSLVPAGEGSAQLAWLRDDLAATPTRCLAAIWHYPLFTSGPNPVQTNMRDAWRVLQLAGAEFVVNGHDHVYERFRPMDEFGQPHPTGIREFIVGTGGAGLYSFFTIHPGSEVRGTAWGVIKFTLDADSYTWQFIPVAGQSFTDSGSVLCH